MTLRYLLFTSVLGVFRFFSVFFGYFSGLGLLRLWFWLGTCTIVFAMGEHISQHTTHNNLFWYLIKAAVRKQQTNYKYNYFTLTF